MCIRDSRKKAGGSSPAAPATSPESGAGQQPAPDSSGSEPDHNTTKARGNTYLDTILASRSDEEKARIYRAVHTLNIDASDPLFALLLLIEDFFAYMAHMNDNGKAQVRGMADDLAMSLEHVSKNIEVERENIDAMLGEVLDKKVRAVFDKAAEDTFEKIDERMREYDQGFQDTQRKIRKDINTTWAVSGREVEKAIDFRLNEMIDLAQKQGKHPVARMVSGGLFLAITVSAIGLVAVISFAAGAVAIEHGAAGVSNFIQSVTGWFR